MNNDLKTRGRRGASIGLLAAFCCFQVARHSTWCVAAGWEEFDEEWNRCYDGHVGRGGWDG